MGQPFVKKFTEERELTVVLVVDASGSGSFGTDASTKMPSPDELMISVISPPGVILKALSLNDPVTYTLPAASTAMPTGLLSELPAPSPDASMISVISPPGVILNALSLPRPTT